MGTLPPGWDEEAERRRAEMVAQAQANQVRKGVEEYMVWKAIAIAVGAAFMVIVFAVFIIYCFMNNVRHPQ